MADEIGDVASSIDLQGEGACSSEPEEGDSPDLVVAAGEKS